MLRRHPQARDILDGKDKHADTVKQLQLVTIGLFDLRQGLCQRAGHIGDD